MEYLTVARARKHLRDKGVHWSCYMDLRHIEMNTKDIEVKSASKRMQTFITMGV